MPRRIRSNAMDLGDILTREQILTDLKASNRWEAIDELINNLVATGKIKPENHDAIAAVVKKRESSMSTGIGFGIAREGHSKIVRILTPMLGFAAAMTLHSLWNFSASIAGDWFLPLGPLLLFGAC